MVVEFKRGVKPVVTSSKTWHAFYSKRDNDFCFYERDDIGGEQYFCTLAELPVEAKQRLEKALGNQEVIYDDFDIIFMS